LNSPDTISGGQRHVVQALFLYRGEQAPVDLGLVLPANDSLKCSHAFNLLDSRGAISVTERVGIIARVRQLACEAARRYLDSREKQGYPLLKSQTAMQPEQA
jgi:glycyl-tRNA synthetase alpha chain